MKPKEILKEYNLIDENKDFKYSYVAQVDTKKSIINYLVEDCIICYRKDFFGFVFIIKTNRKYMAYVGIKREIHLGGMGYTFRRIYELNEALNLMGDDFNILNQEEFDKMKSQIIFEGLDK